MNSLKFISFTFLVLICCHFSISLAQKKPRNRQKETYELKCLFHRKGNLHVLTIRNNIDSNWNMETEPRNFQRLKSLWNNLNILKIPFKVYNQSSSPNVINVCHCRKISDNLDNQKSHLKYFGSDSYLPYFKSSGIDSEDSSIRNSHTESRDCNAECSMCLVVKNGTDKETTLNVGAFIQNHIQFMDLEDLPKEISDSDGFAKEEDKLSDSSGNQRHIESLTLEGKIFEREACGNEALHSTIHFNCLTKYQSLRLLPESEQCHFKFEINLKDGCFIEPYEKPTCLLTSPRTGKDLDLKKLGAAGNIVLETEANHKLWISLCDSDQTLEATSGYVYVFGENGNFVAGRKRKITHFDEYMFEITFSNGDPCYERNTKYSTRINFVCKSVVVEPFPTLVSSFNYVTCTFIVKWYTSLACDSFLDCKVPFKRGYFDLSDMKKTTTNSLNFMKGKEVAFQLGGCHTLNPSDGCPVGSSVCMIVSGNSFSLGKRHNLPVVNNLGEALLFYKRGSLCLADLRKTYSSVIRFHCVENKAKEKLLYSDHLDGCTLLFDMWSKDGCLKSSETDACQLRVSNKVLKFNHLKSTSNYKLKDSNNGALILNICGPVHVGNATSSGVIGASYIDNKGIEHSAGIYSTYLELDNGIPVLKYLLGSKCSDNTFMSTVIYFLCLNKDAKFHFYKVIYEKELCRFIVFWYTKVACLPIHECSVEGDDEEPHSFIHLRKPVGKYRFQFGENQSSIHLNLCQPTPYFLNCRIGSVACWITKTKTKSLGQLHENFIAGRGLPKDPFNVIYSGGDQCGDNSTKTYSTEVVFVCGREVNPSEIYYQNCVFKFIWPTPSACLNSKIFSPLNQNESFNILPRVQKSKGFEKKLHSRAVMTNTEWKSILNLSLDFDITNKIREPNFGNVTFLDICEYRAKINSSCGSVGLSFLEDKIHLDLEVSVNTARNNVTSINYDQEVCICGMKYCYSLSSLDLGSDFCSLPIKDKIKRIISYILSEIKRIMKDYNKNKNKSIINQDQPRDELVYTKLVNVSNNDMSEKFPEDGEKIKNKTFNEKYFCQRVKALNLCRNMMSSEEGSACDETPSSIPLWASSLFFIVLLLGLISMITTGIYMKRNICLQRKLRSIPSTECCSDITSFTCYPSCRTFSDSWFNRCCRHMH